MLKHVSRVTHQSPVTGEACVMQHVAAAQHVRSCLLIQKTQAYIPGVDVQPQGITGGVLPGWRWSLGKAGQG